jgi:hypothetical protein
MKGINGLYRRRAESLTARHAFPLTDLRGGYGSFGNVTDRRHHRRTSADPSDSHGDQVPRDPGGLRDLADALTDRYDPIVGEDALHRLSDFLTVRVPGRRDDRGKTVPELVGERRYGVPRTGTGSWSVRRRRQARSARATAVNILSCGVVRNTATSQYQDLARSQVRHVLPECPGYQ